MGQYQLWFYLLVWLGWGITSQNIRAVEITSDGSTNFTYYAVQGNSARELRASIDEALKDKPASSKHDGITEWHIKWDYNFDQHNGKVRLTDFNVTLKVTIHVPQWTPPPDANSALVKHWNTFLRALTQHENGHARHGQQAALDMIDQVKELDTFPSKSELKAAVQEINDRVLSKYRKADVQYDKDTNHGLRQGAYFP